MKKTIIIASLGLLSLVSCSNETNTQEKKVPATESTTVASTEFTTTVTSTTKSQTAETNTVETVASVSDALGIDYGNEDPWAKYEYYYINIFDENPIICHDDENISIKCIGWAVADDIFSAKFEIENKMDTNIIIATDDTAINDYDIDIHLYDSIVAGKKKILYASSVAQDIQVCSFTGKDITKAEFKFRAINEDTFQTILKTEATVIPVEQVKE